MLIPSHCGRDFKLAADAVPILSPVEDDESPPVSPKGPPMFDENQVTIGGKIPLVQSTKFKPAPSPSRPT